MPRLARRPLAKPVRQTSSVLAAASRSELAKTLFPRWHGKAHARCTNEPLSPSPVELRRQERDDVLPIRVKLRRPEQRSIAYHRQLHRKKNKKIRLLVTQMHNECCAAVACAPAEPRGWALQSRMPRWRGPGASHQTARQQLGMARAA